MSHTRTTSTVASTATGTRTRRAAVVGIAGAAVATTLALVPTAASASTPWGDAAVVTAKPSVSSADSGEQFRVRGVVKAALSGPKKPVANSRVYVATRRAGQWVPLEGAVVRTGSDGRYAVRVILESTGQRVLRVTAASPGGRYVKSSAPFRVSIG